MNDVESLRAELEALKLRIDGLEVRLEARIAAEVEQRKAEIEALREEWRNLAVAISANSTAVAQVAEQMRTEFGEIKAEQKHQSEQLSLIGQALDLLLQDADLKVPT